MNSHKIRVLCATYYPIDGNKAPRDILTQPFVHPLPRTSSRTRRSFDYDTRNSADREDDRRESRRKKAIELGKEARHDAKRREGTREDDQDTAREESQNIVRDGVGSRRLHEAKLEATPDEKWRNLEPAKCLS